MQRTKKKKQVDFVIKSMEKKYDVYSIIEELRKGNQIKCEECKKGYYITSAKDISLAREFNCDYCGNVIRIIPNVIVE